MADLVLALNAGSSTLKFALFQLGETGPLARFRGMVDHLDHAPRMTMRTADGRLVDDRAAPDAAGGGPVDFLRDVLHWAEARVGEDRLAAFSHRIAHGGCEFSDPVELTPERLDRLEALDPLPRCTSPTAWPWRGRWPPNGPGR